MRHLVLICPHESFDVRSADGETVQISFGSSQLRMDLDSAYDLQYRLAEFLAGIELADYAIKSANPSEVDAKFRESYEAIASVAGLVPRSKLRH